MRKYLYYTVCVLHVQGNVHLPIKSFDTGEELLTMKYL